MLKFKTEYYRTIAKDTNAEKTVGELCDEIDRLRGEQQTPPQGKTVRVKVQVVVHPDGRWWAGSDFREEKRISRNNGEEQYWLTATLPVPAEVEVVARVEGE